MIIVGGSFQLDASEREQFLAGRVELMRTSRAEPGCLEYTFAADPVDPERVVLFERWESQEALDAHLARLRLAPPTGGVAPRSSTIAFYDVARERPMGR
ncbi:MAG TPA: putative quinol monooxygenase [Acidimicrobiales bacterium]|nr:putative quinol monooxygenase [Acidimicrobiales bacterium]